MTVSPRMSILGLALALALSACGQDPAAAPEDDPATTPAQDSADEAGEGTEEPVSAEDGAAVGVGTTDLGDVLVDGEGMTLYVFEPDEQAASTCDGDCAASWPPLLTGGDAQASGDLDPALLGTVDREDGTVQVTYDSWPLYRFVGDEAPGDVSGQGLNDVWWVQAPDGTLIRDDAEADTTATGTDGY